MMDCTKRVFGVCPNVTRFFGVDMGVRTFDSKGTREIIQFSYFLRYVYFYESDSNWRGIKPMTLKFPTVILHESCLDLDGKFTRK